jgi:hypothetical protein
VKTLGGGVKDGNPRGFLNIYCQHVVTGGGGGGGGRNIATGYNFKDH